MGKLSENEPLFEEEQVQEEEPKSKVFAKSPYRKRGKEREVTHSLSPEMLPPVTKTKVAIYQAIGLYQKDPLLEGNKTGDTALPYPIVIPGSFVIYDPYQPDLMKRNIVLKNITRPGIEVVDGKRVTVEVVDDITFENGIKEVHQEREFNLYVLMELHPLNESNKRRDRSKPAAFKRIDIVRNSSDGKMGREELYIDAANEIREMEFEKVAAYCANLRLPVHGLQPKEVRYALLMYARKDPVAFFSLNHSSKPMVRINLMDAVEMGFLIYDIDRRGYRFVHEDRPITVVSHHEDPIDRTVDFLRSEKGAESYQKIMDCLSYWD